MPRNCLEHEPDFCSLCRFRARPSSSGMAAKMERWLIPCRAGGGRLVLLRKPVWDASRRDAPRNTASQLLRIEWMVEQPKRADMRSASGRNRASADKGGDVHARGLMRQNSLMWHFWWPGRSHKIFSMQHRQQPVDAGQRGYRGRASSLGLSCGRRRGSTSSRMFKGRDRRPARL